MWGGNLFIKMFIGFWLVTTAILASWMLTNQYFESSPGSEPALARPPGPPRGFMLRMMYDLQNLENDQLKAFAQGAAAEHGMDIYLVGRDGRDLLGREVPPPVAQVARELDGPRRRAFLSTPGGYLSAHEIYRREQGPLRAVFVFRPARHTVVGLLGAHPGLRIGLAVLVGGLVCYALSRVLTNRLRALQLASRRLAEGDLDTRLQVRERGGDETDELARDFNSMAQQLQQRVQAQKRLLADVSHELRSPLARLRIALALAQQDTANGERHLGRIEQEAERLGELIGQLLASQAGGELPLDTHIDLVPLLRQLCADARFEGAAEGKGVAFHPQPEAAVVAGSGDLLRKSFDNILRNAVLHSPRDSDVTATLEQHGGDYRVCIEDCGGGVPEAELVNIFDEFYRLDTARTRDTGGHGLGLAIARRAVERHGGTIRAENTGTGLRVIVTLPASAPPDG